MRKIFLTLSAMLIAVSVLAVPARPGQWRVIKLADGTEVRAELKGDEFCSYWQTADGSKFVRNVQSGIFERADMARLEAAAAPMRAASAAGRTRRTAQRTVIGSDHEPYIGKKRGLVILVDFTNKKFEAAHTRGLFSRIANEEGFSEMNFRGSVRDYFLAQSYGQFDLEFDVVGPVHMKQRYGYYGAPDYDEEFGTYVQNDNYTGVAQMVVDACKAVDDEVDFRDYDWDGDGTADQVFIIYAGHGQADYDDVNTIWPHSSGIQALLGQSPVLDGVKIDTYACSCELNGKGGACGIGAMCHEFSHCLGLPDMYDSRGGYGYGTATWDLMAVGCYNGDAYVPAGYTAYERMYAGWLQPKELSGECVVERMKDLGSSPEACIIYNDANRNEYYLLENRQRTGWDAGLHGEGLLVYHVDFDEAAWACNVVNSPSGQSDLNMEYVRERCVLIPADGDFDMTYATSIGGDAYPNGGNNSLTNTSQPAADVYNRNTDGSYYMNKPVTDITQNADGTVSFSFMKGDGPTGIGSVTDGTADAADGRIYSLDGRYVGRDLSVLKRGVYITGGRKVVR